MIRFVSRPRIIASLVWRGRRPIAIRSRRVGSLDRRRIGTMVGEVAASRKSPGEAGNGSCTSWRVMVAAFGDAGHAFPAIGLARRLASRGHEVIVETWEKWRDPV